MRVYCRNQKSFSIPSFKISWKFSPTFHNLSSIWNNRFFFSPRQSTQRRIPCGFPMHKTGKTGESSIIRVGSQYVTNVSVKGKVDKKSEDLWLPASRYLAFSFLPRREELFMNLKLSVRSKACTVAISSSNRCPGKNARCLNAFHVGWLTALLEPEFQLRGNSRIPESNLTFNRSETGIENSRDLFEIAFSYESFQIKRNRIGFNKGVKKNRAIRS